MKRFGFALMIIAVFAFTSCTWMGQLTDSAGHNVSAYATGRTSYYVVEGAVSAETVGRLEDRYNEFLAETQGVVVVEPTQSMALINDMMMILSVETDDPYGIIGDLIYSLRLFGAEFQGEGDEVKMTAIQPVPRTLYVSYSDGWKQSKRVAEYRK